ncbi:MAG: zf-HC2 domain-containing protein [Armatimonadetes bacterium]|nr:zf-HC2 domain-containing protein [Armatimonadota bacterium]MDE2205150.1 zf-HC2 domain-containing protein [Armatimonadota bacterium]
MTRTQVGDSCPNGMAAEIKALADGELHGRRQRRAEAHLERCEACRSWDQWLRMAAVELRRTDTETASAALRARIIAAARSHPAERLAVQPRRRALLAGAGLVLAAAAAVAAPGLIHRLAQRTLPAHRTAAPTSPLPPVRVALPSRVPQTPTALSPDEVAVNREAERLYRARMQAAAQAANSASRPAPHRYAFSVPVSSGSDARAALLGWAAQSGARLESIHFQPARPAALNSGGIGAPADIRVLMRTSTRRLPQLRKLLGQLTLPAAAPDSASRPPVSPGPAPTAVVEIPPPHSVKAAAVAAAPRAGGGPPIRVLVILRLPVAPGK